MGDGHSMNGPEESPSDVEKFATSSGHHVGGLRTGSDGVLAFYVEVPQDGTYDIRVFANSYNLADPVRETRPHQRLPPRRRRGPAQELRLPLGYKWAVWGHTDTEAELTAGRAPDHPRRRRTPNSASHAGDAVVDQLDLALRDDQVTGPACYDAEFAALGAGARVDYGHAVPRSRGRRTAPGGTATFWVHAADDGEATVTVDRIGPGGRRARRSTARAWGRWRRGREDCGWREREGRRWRDAGIVEPSTFPSSSRRASTRSPSPPRFGHPRPGPPPSGPLTRAPPHLDVPRRGRHHDRRRASHRRLHVRHGGKAVDGIGGGPAQRAHAHRRRPERPAGTR